MKIVKEQKYVTTGQCSSYPNFYNKTNMLNAFPILKLGKLVYTLHISYIKLVV